MYSLSIQLYRKNFLALKYIFFYYNFIYFFYNFFIYKLLLKINGTPINHVRCVDDTPIITNGIQDLQIPNNEIVL